MSFKNLLLLAAFTFLGYQAYSIYFKGAPISLIDDAKCKNIEVFQRVSPSGEFRAVFYDRKCGKQFSTSNASIIPMSAALQNEPGNVLVVGTGYVTQAQWISDTEIKIEYFGYMKNSNSRVNGVKVVFQDNTAKNP